MASEIDVPVVGHDDGRCPVVSALAEAALGAAEPHPSAGILSGVRSFLGSSSHHSNATLFWCDDIRNRRGQSKRSLEFD